jgi:hypothetical protein
MTKKTKAELEQELKIANQRLKAAESRATLMEKTADRAIKERDRIQKENDKMARMLMSGDTQAEVIDLHNQLAEICDMLSVAPLNRNNAAMLCGIAIKGLQARAEDTLKPIIEALGIKYNNYIEAVRLCVDAINWDKKRSKSLEEQLTSYKRSSANIRCDLENELRVVKSSLCKAHEDIELLQQDIDEKQAQIDRLNCELGAAEEDARDKMEWVNDLRGAFTCDMCGNMHTINGKYNWIGHEICTNCYAEKCDQMDKKFPASESVVQSKKNERVVELLQEIIKELQS